MQPKDRKARLQAMQLVLKVELLRQGRNAHVRMVAGWPDPATLPAGERAEAAWQRENAQVQIAQWDAEIGDLERELAALPRHLREQSPALRLWMRVYMTRWGARWGTRLLLWFSKALLWVAHRASAGQHRR